MLLNNLIRVQEKSLATEAVLLEKQSILLFVLGLLPFAEQPPPWQPLEVGSHPELGHGDKENLH